MAKKEEQIGELRKENAKLKTRREKEEQLKAKEEATKIRMMKISRELRQG